MKRLLILLPVSILLLFFTASCNKIDVQTDFDFQVTHLPYQQTLTNDMPVEIRFTIEPLEGSYLHDSTQYWVRYFPSAGSGELKLGTTVLTPNDLFLIPEREFRMYYQPTYNAVSEQHTLDMVFVDSYKHKKELTITFNPKTSTDEDYPELGEWYQS